MAQDANLSQSLRRSFAACDLSWGAELPAEATSTEWHTVIASDVVYSPEGYQPLYQTLRMLLLHEKTSRYRDVHTICILAHRHRHPEDKTFFALLQHDPELLMKEVDWRVETSSESSSKDTAVDIQLFLIQAQPIGSIAP